MGCGTADRSARRAGGAHGLHRHRAGASPDCGSDRGTRAEFRLAHPDRTDRGDDLGRDPAARRAPVRSPGVVRGIAADRHRLAAPRLAWQSAADRSAGIGSRHPPSAAEIAAEREAGAHSSRLRHPGRTARYRAAPLREGMDRRSQIGSRPGQGRHSCGPGADRSEGAGPRRRRSVGAASGCRARPRSLRYRRPIAKPGGRCGGRDRRHPPAHRSAYRWRRQLACLGGQCSAGSVRAADGGVGTVGEERSLQPERAACAGAILDRQESAVDRSQGAAECPCDPRGPAPERQRLAALGRAQGRKQGRHRPGPIEFRRRHDRNRPHPAGGAVPEHERPPGAGNRDFERGLQPSQFCLSADLPESRVRQYRFRGCEGGRAGPLVESPGERAGAADRAPRDRGRRRRRRYPRQPAGAGRAQGHRQASDRGRPCHHVRQVARQGEPVRRSRHRTLRRGALGRHDALRHSWPRHRRRADRAEGRAERCRARQSRDGQGARLGAAVRQPLPARAGGRIAAARNRSGAHERRYHPLLQPQDRRTDDPHPGRGDEAARRDLPIRRIGPARHLWRVRDDLGWADRTAEAGDPASKPERGHGPGRRAAPARSDVGGLCLSGRGRIHAWTVHLARGDPVARGPAGDDPSGVAERFGHERDGIAKVRSGWLRRTAQCRRRWGDGSFAVQPGWRRAADRSSSERAGCKVPGASADRNPSRQTGWRDPAQSGGDLGGGKGLVARHDARHAVARAAGRDSKPPRRRWPG